MNTAKKCAMGDLVRKYSDDEWMVKTIEGGYGKKIVSMEEGGSIDFDPEGLKTVVNGERLTYNDYIDAQIQAIGYTHSGFQQCFYNHPIEFKGQIERISKDRRVCFQRIYISGMYPDGECFESKEDHVWMDRVGFETLHVGDCVSFFAEPYRYLKTGNGKRIDYALRNPTSVKKIERYDLPADEMLLRQERDLLLCDSCFLNECCSQMLCPIQNRNSAIKQDMMRVMTQNEKSD